MGFQRNYFKQQAGAPEPLRATATRRVRFEETDMLGIVWHGNYVSYLEDGRIAFGDKYGLSYKNFTVERFAAPIVQMHLDFFSPLRFDDIIEIEAIHYWSDALRLDFEYRISCQKTLVARGYTVQLLTDLEGQLLLSPPGLAQDFRKKWLEGGFK